METIRIAVEQREDKRWMLHTADFDGFCRVLGLDVVVAFACCYAHADRLNGLVQLFMPDRERHKRSIWAQRNFNAFYAMAGGILKEIALKLEQLRSALKVRKLWDEDEWNHGVRKRDVDGLKKWVKWGSASGASDLRNKFAFHVDTDWMRKGITTLRRRARRKVKRGRQTVIYQGETEQLADSVFRLSHDALFLGASTKNIYKELEGMFGIFPALDYCLGKTLQRAGLKPTQIRVSGGLASRFAS